MTFALLLEMDKGQCLLILTIEGGEGSGLSHEATQGLLHYIIGGDFINVFCVSHMSN